MRIFEIGDGDVVNTRKSLREFRKPLMKSQKGWSKSIVDPNGLLDYFPTLRVKDGYKLVSYQFMDESRMNGNGFIWALPSGAPFPEPDQCEWVSGRFLRFVDIPKPQGALDDFMEGIEGDETPSSYLEASLFAREAKEFGAIWHGLNWDTHKSPIFLVIKGWDSAVVIILTYSGLHQATVYCYVDIYKNGSYAFTTKENILYRGEGGYYF